MRHSYSILIILASLSSVASAKIIHVPGDSATIQSGINGAIDGDTVLIASGIYSGQGNVDLVIGGKKILISGSANPTIINAIGSFGFRLDNSGEDSNTVISNLSIRDAIAGIFLNSVGLRVINLTISQCSTGVGGYPLYEGYDCNLIIENSRFVSNQISLAFISHSKGRIENCLFTSNAIGILIDNGAATIRHSIFTGNARGISSDYVYEDTLIIEKSSFVSNQIGLVFSRSSAIIDSSSLINNDTSIFGGCILSNSIVRGGTVGISAPFSEISIIEDCLFDSVMNTVFRAGYYFPDFREKRAVILQDAPPGFTVSNSTISRCGDVAVIAIIDEGSYLSLTNCQIVQNAGGIRLQGPLANLIMDHCLYMQNGREISYHSTFRGRLLIDACTIAHNLGDGINLSCYSLSAKIRNSIIAFNGGFGAKADFDPPSDTISYSDFFGNVRGNFSGIDDPTGQRGNICADPLFMAGDPFDYHLQIGSPAIDSGDPEALPDPDGSRADMGAYFYDHRVAIDEDGLPLAFELRQNYPNPFNPTTNISFSLDKPAQTLIIIYNLLGQRVMTLMNEYKLAGEYSVIWDGKDGYGREVSSGVYFYLIQSGEHVQTRKMTLLR